MMELGTSNPIDRIQRGGKKVVASSSGISVTGLITADSGIKPKSTSTALTEYEEGTWTPSVGGTATYGGARSGRYTRIGRLVYLYCDMDIATIGTGSVHSITGGCPFTAVGTGSGSVTYWTGAAGSFVFVTFSFINASTYPTFCANTAAATALTTSPTFFQNSTRAIGAVIFEV
jgi:hypothetical protein